jgi:polyferredoxin
VRLSDGSIRNGYTVKVRNMEERPRAVEVTIDGMPGGLLWTEASGRGQAARSLTLNVAPDQVAQAQLFVAGPAAGPERTDLTFTVRALDAEGGTARDKSFFERPEQPE